MLESIINALIDKYFRKESSIFLAILIGGIAICLSIEYIVNNTILIMLILLIIGIVIYYIIETIKYNLLPKNKLNNAILLRIIAKDKEEYDDILFKFGSELKKYFDEEKINILAIPYHLVKKHEYNDKDKIISLLHKTNCIFLTTIKTKSEELHQDTKYITEINVGIIHPKYLEKIENIFQNEVNILGMSTSKIKYQKEDKLETLEITAQKVSMVCKYLIARASFFNCDLDNSIMISEVLYNELKNISDISCQKIKELNSNLCYDNHIAKMLIENYKRNPDINIVEKELNEANKYRKDTYIYYEGLSVCCFLKSRDVKKTKDYLGKCKEIYKNGPWKYSVAFLKAYCDESEGKVLYSYKQALKIPYEHINLIYFIEDILKEEPEKNMLRFALFLLYLKIQDIKIVKEVLKEYLKNKKNDNLEENTIKQLNSIFGEKLVNEVLL